MTSFRQIEANRRNALRSTGPNTEEGKRRSRQNAVRHGLCAETVVDILEDVEDYRGFEAAVIADYDARTAVERELVLRLASLLWRLRRATAIETDLLRIQGEILRERQGRTPDRTKHQTAPIFEAVSVGDEHRNENDNDQWGADGDSTSRPPPQPLDSVRQLTLCFQRLANFDNSLFERLGRYESAIARQVLKTHYLLRSIRSW
jgi:hypothetical protein